MKNKGFIATSLIYSFFLVFIAILAATLRVCIYNNTIVERFNTEAINELNKNKFDVTIITKGAENSRIIKDKDTENTLTKGQTLTNLIEDGTFTNQTGRWTTNGSINFIPNTRYENKNCLYLSNGSKDSYLYQSNILTVQGDLYYLSLEYAGISDNTFYTHISSTPEQITNQNNSLSWTKASKVFTETNASGTDKRLIVGLASNPYSSGIYYTNALLVNLTSHYGKGREPNEEWFYKHIDYFDGSINYLIEENINKGEDLLIKMVTTKAENEYNTASIECTGKNNNWINDYSIDYKKYTPVGKTTDKYDGYLTLKNITDDIKCFIEWKKV